MSYNWVICVTNDDRTVPFMNMSFRTKHQSKVGKYIRNNIEDFLSIFQMIKGFGRYNNCNSMLQNELAKIDYDDLYNQEIASEELKEILKDLTDKEIVDEINKCQDARGEIFITIINTPVENTISL